MVDLSTFAIQVKYCKSILCLVDEILSLCECRGISGFQVSLFELAAKQRPAVLGCIDDKYEQLSHPSLLTPSQSAVALSLDARYSSRIPVFSLNSLIAQ